MDSDPSVVGAALGVEVVATFVIAERTFMVARMQVGEASGLVGVTMGELGGHTRVVAMQRSEGHVVPRRAERFRAGDLAHVVGPVDDVIALAQRAQVTSSFSSSARALPA